MKSFAVFFAVLIAIVCTPAARANGPWQRLYQDIKLPSQAMLEHYTWTTPVLGASTTVLNSVALGSSAATTISSGFGTPDFPRNITLTPDATTSSVGAGTAVVTGTNIFGKTISENFTISSTQSTATTGAKAFKTVTSIVFPATSGSGAHLSVGVGTKLGLPRCTVSAGNYVFSIFNNAYETSRGTMVSNASAVESNTFVPNGSMDGAKNVELFYVENFGCYPN